MSLARDTIKLFAKHAITQNDQDLLNAVQFATVLETRCNYLATLEGVVLSHRVRQWLRATDGVGFKRIIAGILLINEVLINTLDDIFVLLMAWMAIQEHGDIFDFGLILGKVSKIMIQLYLEGLIFKNYKEYNN